MSVGLQLYREVKLLYVHTLNVMFALHVDTTTFTDDTYEIS
jgi:hypothetical protein